MNFQTVSTAEKLKSSPAVLIGPDSHGNYTDGPSLPGGYVTVGGQQVPGPLLQGALDYVNFALQQMANTIQADHEADSTAIVLTAKHGQSPLDNNQLQRIDDGPIVSGVNAAWAALHPSNPTLVVQEADDDGLLWWLSDRSQAATEFVKDYLWTHSAPAVNYAGQTITVQHSGLSQIFAGNESAQYFGVSNSDPRHPDVFGISQVGTIYTGGSKIAEHGGANPGDRDVPLVVYAPGTVQPAQSAEGVETTQVAPDDPEAARTFSELAPVRSAPGHTGPPRPRRPPLTDPSDGLRGGSAPPAPQPGDGEHSSADRQGTRRQAQPGRVASRPIPCSYRWRRASGRRFVRAKRQPNRRAVRVTVFYRAVLRRGRRLGSSSTAMHREAASGRIKMVDDPSLFLTNRFCFDPVGTIRATRCSRSPPFRP